VGKGDTTPKMARNKNNLGVTMPGTKQFKECFTKKKRKRGYNFQATRLEKEAPPPHNEPYLQGAKTDPSSGGEITTGFFLVFREQN